MAHLRVSLDCKSRERIDMGNILTKIDTAIYGFIGPFGTLYVFPHAFLAWERQLGIERASYEVLSFAGSMLMWIGGALALWCVGALYVRKATITPFERPRALVVSGPYRVVRHPMMWSLVFVLLGEALFYSSPMIAVWLLMWSRFSTMYINQYEEPHLRAIFGEQYLEYCRRTPQWLPLFKPR